MNSSDDLFITIKNKLNDIDMSLKKSVNDTKKEYLSNHLSRPKSYVKKHDWISDINITSLDYETLRNLYIKTLDRDTILQKMFQLELDSRSDDINNYDTYIKFLLSSLDRYAKYLCNIFDDTEWCISTESTRFLYLDEGETLISNSVPLEQSNSIILRKFCTDMTQFFNRSTSKFSVRYNILEDDDVSLSWVYFKVCEKIE